MLESTPLVIDKTTAIPGQVAKRMESICAQAIARRGQAHIAFSGGSTPRALFKLLATPAWRNLFEWAHIHIWWVDERCVPPDEPDSNYGVAFQLLLRHLTVSNVHRMHGEDADHARAAAKYEEEVRECFHLSKHARPRFDLILLGMGDDGHTASLFPGTTALEEQDKLVTVGEAPVKPHARITLTLPVLNRAANVFFVVTGAGKGPALRQVFDPDPTIVALPAARVRPGNGHLTWLLDDAAAQAAKLH
ncbi:MAG: 6-phosphogluconolactonase [Chloroflexi bacterium]|nr:6-phosphogluconolactonase [Chloroflexota bacterium]